MPFLLLFSLGIAVVVDADSDIVDFRMMIEGRWLWWDIRL